MVVWTHTDNLKFIEMYQNEACIWNPKHKYHRDKVKINDAWIRIADALEVSVEDAKKKKETLLSAFRLNHKKVLASRKSAAAEDEVFKPLWVYYDALAAFMADVYENKPPVINPDYQDEGESPFHQTSYVYVPQATDESSDGEDRMNAAQNTSRFTIKKRRRMIKPERVDLQETNALVKDAVSTLNNVLSEYENKASEDECDLYGRLLAKKLRQFTELDRLDLMHQIDGMVLKKRKSLGSSSYEFTPLK